MTYKQYILLILLCIGWGFLLFLHLVEVTMLASYGNCLTAGEVIAYITANPYETSDMWGYGYRYIYPYWILFSFFYIVGIYWFWRVIKSPTKYKTISLCLILTLLSVSLAVPGTAYNMLGEIRCAIRQVNQITANNGKANSFYASQCQQKFCQKQIYVLSIGESLRYKNMSLNGIYFRHTTPLLEQQTNLCLYADYYANATLTQHAIPLLFTPSNTSDFNEHFQYKTIAAAFKETGFKTALISHRAQLMNNGYHNYLAQDFDTIIWVEQDSLIAQALTKLAEQEQHLFVVTHYLGNHMFYTNRTEDCLVWRPDYNADPKVKSDSLFLNAYDNSLLYTDRLLHDAISVLDSTNTICSWLFISDHGEFISSRVSGHGHTYHPTKDEYHVPLMVWYSDEYAAAHPSKIANMLHHKDEPICADHVFWSVLDMANIRIDSTLQQDGMSIFRDTLLPHQRTLLLPDGKSVMSLD